MQPEGRADACNNQVLGKKQIEYEQSAGEEKCLLFFGNKLVKKKSLFVSLCFPAPHLKCYLVKILLVNF